MIAAETLIRQATIADNDALLALADMCPMDGPIALAIDRRPDFFALAAIEREWSTVEVADDDGSITGCIAVVSRRAWVNGVDTPIAYVGDLKVHPAHRDGRVADALITRSTVVARTLVGDTGTILCSTLRGNRAMERRARGRPGQPALHRVATIRSYAIPLIRHPGLRKWRATLRVERAMPADADEMAAHWHSVAPGRQLSPILDAPSIAEWMCVPGFSYWLARDRSNRLIGFIGVWDQRAVRRLRVHRYSTSLTRARRIFNLAAPVLGAAQLPPAGDALRHAETLHLCVRPSDLNTLRTLALAVHHALRGHDLSFFTIPLDVRDPLAKALSGFWSQPTDIDVRVTAPTGQYAGPALDGRPVQYETALV